MMACRHDWKPTGRADHHAIAEDKNGRPVQKVTYLRCANCQQNGFTKPPSRMIYTWKEG